MELPESPAAKSVAKRKRSKRPRPVPAAAASSASSSSAEFSSGCTAADDDDDDMAANCLILLAQGRCDSPAADDVVVVEIRPEESPLPAAPARQGGGDRQNEKFAGGSRRFTAGFYVYECKTCSKCFPSFQALGGHRASHKKPRLAAEEKKKAAVAVAAEETKDLQPFPSRHVISPCAQNYGASSSSHNNNGSKAVARVHECGICGAEFGSGQALGGHMRRHRPLGASAEAAESKKEERRGVQFCRWISTSRPPPTTSTDASPRSQSHSFSSSSSSSTSSRPRLW